MKNLVKGLLQEDMFDEARKPELFIGRPFYLDYDKAHVLVNDAWKQRVKGIPQGAFLLAFYDNEENEQEALLLRALKPAKLPTDSDVISSMIEYYKDNLKTAGKGSQLDQFTRYEFSFSGLECRVLGTFYKVNIKSKDGGEKTITEFGADVENFYAANNYSVYKATGDVLKQIANQRDGDSIAGNENEFEIGCVRYSSSRKFAIGEETNVPVYINPKDFLGKRTALFGMTRTGKSNSVKKIIEATVEISNKAKEKILPKTIKGLSGSLSELLNPFYKLGAPKYPVGQIIFDINGEYANPNMQDDGTAIYELYRNDVIRFSVLEKPDFKVLKINFYSDISAGFDLIKSSLTKEQGDYIKSFNAIDLGEPENYHLPIADKTSDERTASIIYDRKKAIYMCCLKQAKFPLPINIQKIKFFAMLKL